MSRKTLVPKPFRLIVALAGVAVFATIGRAAESAKIELHTLPTVTLSDEQFLTGAKDGKPVVIAAELRLLDSARIGCPRWSSCTDPAGFWATKIGGPAS